MCRCRSTTHSPGLGSRGHAGNVVAGACEWHHVCVRLAIMLTIEVGMWITTGGRAREDALRRWHRSRGPGLQGPKHI